ncbi:MAG: gluconolaconase [Lysobacteraceae bacterium]|nr:MAG: gluconolaconase [Xanthomonadaceae bacterium]
MTRSAWIWLAAALTAAALLATFLFDLPLRTDAPAAPRATPFGWNAQLQLAAGDGHRGGREGPALQARFDDPFGLAVDRHGNVFVADAGDNNRIRRIGTDGQVGTLAGAGEGFVDGSGVQAKFDTPSGLAIDAEGNLYVADTGNHAIRRVTPMGEVTTLAGDGTAGHADGPALQARFNAPQGVAVDANGNVYVADTHNDRIRRIGTDGLVSTLAGGRMPGYQDGVGEFAQFDTPTSLARDALGNLWVADLRNNAIRKLSSTGEVTTLVRTAPEDAGPDPIRRPLSIAVTRDGMLYVGEMSRGRVVQLSRSGQVHVLAGDRMATRLARPAGVAVGADGALLVTDASSHRVHRLAPAPVGTMPLQGITGPAPADPLPSTQGRWPLRPQQGWHEVVGTLGEVRGNYRSESRHHLHGGLDIRGDVGAEVLAIADAKVSSPSGAWGLGELAEGVALGDLNYIHMRVGRDARDRVIDPERFQQLLDGEGKPERMRVARGTRFKAGDVLGSVNRMAHVHLSVGANGFERNAVALGFTGYADHYPPRIHAIELLDPFDQPLSDKRDGRVVVPRALPGVRIVVDAWDQVDRNLPRRRLGLHAVGYQLLDAQGTPLPGFEQPRMDIVFNRMPADDAAVKIAYAPGSGITVHGNAVTHFKYIVTNVVRDGQLSTGLWRTSELPAGDYLVRITASDYSGNLASAGRDLRVTLE